MKGLNGNWDLPIFALGKWDLGDKFSMLLAFSKKVDKSTAWEICELMTKECCTHWSEDISITCQQ